jgi:hypothetical protein
VLAGLRIGQIRKGFNIQAISDELDDRGLARATRTDENV